jgi:uncharacterized protein (DUF1800 family)
MDGASMSLAEPAPDPPGSSASLAAAAAAPPAAWITVPLAERRLLAGHILRRTTFGPTPAEIDFVTRLGYPRWVNYQLGPIYDGTCIARLPRPTLNKYDDWTRLKRWYARMVCTRRQLNERMTLAWHELFATSNEKVGVALLMEKQEVMLRRLALTNFRSLLLAITTDQAMLVFLDNDPNRTLFDEEGNMIPPNRNYAREFLQLFTLGPVLLNMDGTPIRDAQGIPLPTYTEEDVNEVARALTGWEVDWRTFRFARFIPSSHDPGPKTILGTALAGRRGVYGAREVNDVVDIVMKHPNLPPFISKYLIQKLATERPSPAYVERVATVFRDSKGDLRRTVRAILLDAEFTASLRAEYKEPIEHFVGPARALEARSDGASFIDWTYLTKQLLYYPPSVFSFYPPGQKRQLVTTATVTYRDRGADELAASWWSTKYDPKLLIRKYRLTTPEQTVDFLADRLLVAPLEPDVRQRVVDYMGGHVDEWKFKGAVWLIMISPDFQRN